MKSHPTPNGTILRPCPDCGGPVNGYEFKQWDRCAGCAAKQYPANPWAGRHDCPGCGSADWTLPTMIDGFGPWRCCACSVSFDPARTAVG